MIQNISFRKKETVARNTLTHSNALCSMTRVADVVNGSGIPTRHAAGYSEYCTPYSVTEHPYASLNSFDFQTSEGRVARVERLVLVLGAG